MFAKVTNSGGSADPDRSLKMLWFCLSHFVRAKPISKVAVKWPTPDPCNQRFLLQMSLLTMAVEEERCWVQVRCPCCSSRSGSCQDARVSGQAPEHTHLLQLTHGCRPFSLQEVHLRALKESVKQLRNTDILLPWHIGHGMKAKSPQVWHIWGCWTLWEMDKWSLHLFQERPLACSHTLIIL